MKKKCILFVCLRNILPCFLQNEKFNLRIKTFSNKISRSDKEFFIWQELNFANDSLNRAIREN